MRNYLVGLEAKMFARGYICAPTVCDEYQNLTNWFYKNKYLNYLTIIVNILGLLLALYLKF